MATLKPTAPWVTFYRELNELFRRDMDIDIIYDEENNIIKMYVGDPVKADALQKLLPTEKSFWDVTLKIDVVPANKLSVTSPASYTAAFLNNPAVDEIKTVNNGRGKFTYIIFENRVVQYFNDDISDLNGLSSTLYQDIAKRIFGNVDGIYFCTNLNFG